MKKFFPVKASDVIIPISVAVFNVLVILFPRDIIDASRDGLNLWWLNVVPALLPFIIGTNILTGLGIVRFLGALLEPFMYALFGVPGAGGFALITGMTSGYPMGAKVTAMLREDKELTRTEAQRLIGFSNNSGPLFVIGAVGIGMFGSAKAGYFILGVHYFSAIVNGIIFRYYNFSERKSIRREKRVFSKAYYAMKIARSKDGRTFGRLLGDSVKNAMETIAQIGGFIILFSVIVKIFNMASGLGAVEEFFKSVSAFLGAGQDLINGSIAGLIEMTNGCKAIAGTGFGKAQIVLCCAAVSFGGFSIHAQSINFISKTDIKTSVYIFSKLLHACLAAITAGVMYPLFNLSAPAEQTVEAFSFFREGFFNRLMASTLGFAASVAVIIFAVALVNMKSISGRRRRY